MINKPVIFISATSDLRTARDLVGKVLYSMGYEPVWQDIAATEGGELLDVLRRRIEPAALVIQLVDQRYGAEPPLPTNEFGRVSYTQFEALEAERLGKKVIYHFLDDKFPTDRAAAEPPEIAALQAAYCQRLKDTNRLRYEQIADTSELELSIRRISDELAALRHQADRRQRNLARLGVGAVVGIAAVAALTLAVFQRLEKQAAEMNARLDKQTQELNERLDTAQALVKAAVTPKPLAAGQTQPDPIPPEILVKAQLLSERGNAEQRALGMIALNQHQQADQLIQQLKSKPGNPIDEAFQLLSMEGDNWYQAGEADKALGPYEQALSLKPNDFKAHNQLVCALILGRDGDVAARRLRAIKVSEQALKLVPSGSTDWAKTQNNIGIAWQNLPTRDAAAKTKNVEQAIAAYQAALGVYTKTADPADWAWTQDNLGLAWSDLPAASTAENAENLRRAITAFEAALSVRTKETHPADWARTQHSLGLAWLNLPTGNHAENLKYATAAFEAALDVPAASVSPQSRLSDETGLSWAQLLAKDFAGALASARPAAGEDNIYLPLEINYAHAVLLSGRTAEAQAIYLKHVGEKMDGTDKSWQQAVLQDFDDLEKNGIESPEYAKVTELLKQADKTKPPSGKPAMTPAPGK
jgi:tetratricopeptide (TPR) repeat protein